jgi:hypothetical protein
MPNSPLPISRIAVVAVLGIALLLAFQFSSCENGVTESGVVMSLPTQIGSFIGKDQEISQGEKYVLPKDTEIVKKVYTNPFGDTIYAQIVLSGAEKRSIHRPELCLPAQGWSISSRQTIPVIIADGRRISVMQDTISRQIEVAPDVTRPLTSLYCYWFIGKDTTTSSHIMRVFLSSWDRIFHHKNHRWAYVAVSAPVLQGFREGGKDVEATQKMISDFISDIGPTVMKKTDDKFRDLSSEK